MGVEIVQRDPRLAAVVRRLVGAYEPLRVYLFGSVARGETRSDSDYEELVAETNTRFPTEGRI